MDPLTDFLIAFISDQNNPVGLAVLAAAAMLEYLFPPFPGDTITLFGAVLITAYDWSFWGVFGAVLLGSVAGSMGVFHLGEWLRQRRGDERVHHPTRWATLDRLVMRFQRHGAAWLVLNRFLPGVRSLFFVAAGMADMRASAVLFYSTISAALWNLGLIALGSALGANFDTLLIWVRRYNLGIWSVLAAIAAGLALRAGWRLLRARRRRRHERPGDHPDTGQGGPETARPEAGGRPGASGDERPP